MAEAEEMFYAGQVHEEFCRVVDVVTLQLRETLNNIDGASLADLVHNIVTASKISCYGVGREGLAMKGLAMRLYHLGFQASSQDKVKRHSCSEMNIST